MKYPEWLANMVVVPKKGNKWRVCVDYIDLNKAYPKDSFCLLCIDQIVDVVTGHGILSFLYAFFLYHHVPKNPLDAEKTTFITPHGLYYYNVMLFGLKNVRATYQRLVTKIFQPLLGGTMEVYVDYIIVKSKKRFDQIEHLQEAFELLRKYSMKLNPLKCAFGVNSGKKLRLYGDREMDRGQSYSTQSYNGFSYSYLQKRSTTIDWLAGNSWAVHISFHRSVKTLFYLSKGSKKSRFE